MLALFFLTLSVCSGILVFFTAAGASIVLNVVFLATTGLFLYFLVRLVALSASASICSHPDMQHGSEPDREPSGRELQGSDEMPSGAESSDRSV